MENCRKKGIKLQEKEKCKKKQNYKKETNAKVKLK